MKAGLLSTTETPAAVCLNCGALLQGRFCASCGQDHRRARLSVRDWVADLLGGITNLEGRVLHTVIDLTLRPGAMARAYVEGHRVRYVSPARYALATCALWFLGVALNPEASTIWWVKYGQLINLASVPAMAWIVHVSFLRSKRNYAENLAYMFFVSGHTFLWRALLATLVLFPTPPSGLAVNLFDFVLYLAYTVWSLLGFHRGVPWRGLRVAVAIIGINVFGTLLNLVLQRLTPA